MANASASHETNNDPLDQLSQAWIERSSQEYEFGLAVTKQSDDIASAIAAGAPASLEQFVYASLGGHPDWRAMYTKIDTINEQIQANIPLAIFVGGVMRYFGYPQKSGARAGVFSSSNDALAFDRTFETTEQRNKTLAKLIPSIGQTGAAETRSYVSTLSLPMRSLHDFRSHYEQSLDLSELKNMFRSTVNLAYGSPYPRPEYNFLLTDSHDENPADKYVIASGMEAIVTVTHRNLDDENLERLRYAFKHEEEDVERYVD